MNSGTKTPAEIGKQVFCQTLELTPPPKKYLDQKIDRKKINRDGPYFYPDKESSKTFSRLEYLIEIFKHNNPTTQDTSIEGYLKQHFRYDTQESKGDEEAFEKSHRFPKHHFHHKELKEITEIAKRTKIQNKPVLENVGTENGIVNAKTETTKVSVVIYANEQHIGGFGFPSEEHTQEEAVAAKYSNAIMYMPYDRSIPSENIPDNGFSSAGSYTGTEYWSGKRLEPTSSEYGFRRFGGGYSLHNEGLVLLANDAGRLLPTPINFEPIFVAAPQRSCYPKDAVLYIRHITSIIDAQYDLAAQAADEAKQEGKTHQLITGALGCGAFGNSPYIVAYLQILLLQKNAYQNLRVNFCIPKSQEEKNFESNGDIDFTRITTDFRPPKNHSVFGFVTTHFLELSRRPSFQAINQILTDGECRYSSLSELETACQTEVNNLYQYKKQNPGVLSGTDLENKTSSATASNDNNTAPQSSRCTCSLFLKMISAIATVGGILLLMVLHTPIGIAAGITSLCIGLTLFAVSEKKKQDAPALTTSPSLTSP